MDARFSLGKLMGVPLAGATGLGSFLRHARLFHPRGFVFEAKLSLLDGIDPPFRQVGHSFEGTALVRLSNAMWKQPSDHFDVLGMALRIGWRPSDSTSIHAWHQDLLFATIQHSWTMPSSPFMTKTSDFLQNNYYSVSHFRVKDLGSFKFRVRPSSTDHPTSGTREEKLHEQLSHGKLHFVIEARQTGLLKHWVPLAELSLQREVDLDQEALRFDPFQTGRDIKPAGLINGLRVATYWASQKMRP